MSPENQLNLKRLEEICLAQINQPKQPEILMPKRFKFSTPGDGIGDDKMHGDCCKCHACNSIA